MNIKPLIFGKNELSRIVSVEPDGVGNCEIFRELKNGELVSEIVPMKYYILFTRPLSNKFKLLKGDQPFKYIRTYPTRELYYNSIRKCSNKGLEIFTVRDPKEHFLTRYGYTYYKEMTPLEVSTLSFDIEDTYGIGKVPDENGRILLIANTFRKGNKLIKKQFAYDEYKSERELLKAWSKWFRKMNPSIVLGHNIYGHDLKIINYAAKRCKLKLRLGRNGSEMFINKRESSFRKDGSQAYKYNNIYIYGRELVDTWFLAIKYDQASRREYENYKLKYIINYEGLEKSNRVHYDAANIKNDYKDPDKWELIKQYNKDDSDDPLSYFDKVIPVFFQFAKSLPRSFQSTINSATGSQVNSLMVRSYLQIGHSIARADEQKPYPGAISFCIPGKHKNVFKVDVQSLYPSIILTYKLIDRKKDPKRHMIKMLRYFTESRLKNKKRYEDTGKIRYKILSDSEKILINSVYGFFGAPRLNYNCPKIAAKVTEYGRNILLTAIEWATGKKSIPENAIGGKVKTNENA